MPVRYVLNRLKRFFVYRVLHVDDTPHRIALGLAIGIFVTWTPTIGFQMALTVALAWVLRANKAVGVPFVWISNPLTLLPIYWPSYRLGCWLLGGNYDSRRFFDFLAAAASPGGFLERLGAFWRSVWLIFWPLWVGSVVVALLLGVLAYFATLYAVIKYRQHWHRKHPDRPWKHHAPPPAKPDDAPE